MKASCQRCNNVTEVADVRKWDGLCDSCDPMRDMVPVAPTLAQKINHNHVTIAIGFDARSVSDWISFMPAVIAHIGAYVVPQYGDKGEDQATDWTPAQVVEQIKKYANRHGRNSRPGQDELDLLKIAHYAQIAWSKLQEAKNVGN